jgi:hypothetical protein
MYHLILVAPIIRVLNVSGSFNYTVSVSVKYVAVDIIGGSGGGGGSCRYGSSSYNGGGGGGCGGRSRGIFSAAQLRSPVLCVIGKGGAGSNTAGGDGVPSSFGNLITANGGKGGGRSCASALASGGVGGEAVQGFQYFSFSGYNGLDGAFGAVGSLANGGLGGSCGWANSAGGRGACNDAGQCAITGGAGSNGVIVITEYYQ